MNIDIKDQFSLYRYVIELTFMEKLRECKWWHFVKRREVYRWRDKNLQELEKRKSLAEARDRENKLSGQRLKATKELSDIFAEINALKPGERYILDESRARYLIMSSWEKRSLEEILDGGKEHFKITRFENLPEYRIELIFERMK